MDQMSQLTCQTGPNVRSSTEAIIYLNKLPLKDKQKPVIIQSHKNRFHLIATEEGKEMSCILICTEATGYFKERMREQREAACRGSTESEN